MTMLTRVIRHMTHATRDGIPEYDGCIPDTFKYGVTSYEFGGAHFHDQLMMPYFRNTYISPIHPVLTVTIPDYGDDITVCSNVGTYLGFVACDIFTAPCNFIHMAIQCYSIRFHNEMW